MTDEEKTEFAVFETPEEAATHVVETAGVRPGAKVLEPNCGSGRLVKACLAAGATDIRCYDIRIEACQAAERLGDGVVATECDFLDVEPERIYDFVVMNPPFTRGADLKHIAHAFKFLKKGGVMVSIMPRRPEEKIVKALGEACGGFIQVTPLPELTFDDEGTKVDTCFFYAENMAEEEEEPDWEARAAERKPRVETNAPMASISVPGLIGTMNAIKGLLKRVDDAVLEVKGAYAELEAQLPDVHGMRGSYGLRFNSRFGLEEHYDPSTRCQVENEHELNKLAWRIALVRTQVWTVMDAEERKRFDEALESKKTCPAFSVETVEPTLERLRKSAGLFFVRGIEKVFRALSWNHVTNTPFRFERKAIFEFVVEHGYGRGCYPHFAYNGRGDSLNDLYSALHVLDGKPEPDHQSSLTAKADEFWHTIGKYCDYEDSYVQVRPFKNRNVHLWIVRPDLLAALNETMGKKLPLARRPKDGKRGS